MDKDSWSNIDAFFPLVVFCFDFFGIIQRELQALIFSIGNIFFI